MIKYKNLYNTKIFLSMTFTLNTYNNFVLQLKRFIQHLLHDSLISKYMLININTQKVSYIQVGSILLLRGS